jgi:CRP-like cAMP-binding protein
MQNVQISLRLEKGLKINFSNDITRMIDSKASIVTFPAKKTVLLEGEKPSRLYYILHGIVRGYYIDKQGNDITKCFCNEKGFFSSEGLRTGGLSSFSIECLEECQCIQLPYVLLCEIMEKDNSLKNLFHMFCMSEVNKLENRAKNLVLMNAKERYIDFCNQYPRLIGRVDLQYIASYIGIRAASLSRIRKEINK